METKKVVRETQKRREMNPRSFLFLLLLFSILLHELLSNLSVVFQIHLAKDNLSVHVDEPSCSIQCT